jgi:hypothetical protein
MRGISAIVFTVLVCTSCGSKMTVSNAWPYGVKYEIFVLSFADADGDGKGDLKGLTQKLDYVESLGVNGIWLMPIISTMFRITRTFILIMARWKISKRLPPKHTSAAFM